ncbi:MAG: L-rhamnose mutarotase [Christensenellales bacterium]|jgi:L-rhamnose mutarotase
MERILAVIKVKPEHREDYVRLHLNPWPEMLKALADAGFINEAIWYFEDQSIIYFEVPDGAYDACDARVRATEICQRWDALTLPWFARGAELPPKIFDLREMLAATEGERHSAGRDEQ